MSKSQRVRKKGKGKDEISFLALDAGLDFSPFYPTVVSVYSPYRAHTKTDLEKLRCQRQEAALKKRSLGTKFPVF